MRDNEKRAFKVQYNYKQDDELKNLEIMEQHFEKGAFIPKKWKKNNWQKG